MKTLLAAATAAFLATTGIASAQSFTIYRGDYDPSNPKANFDVPTLSFSLTGLKPTSSTSDTSIFTNVTLTYGTPSAAFDSIGDVDFFSGNSGTGFTAGGYEFRGYSFSGSAAAPAFDAGQFSLKDFDAGAEATLIVDAVPGAVPEPATWAMMMLGFGMVGFGLRRRAKQTVRVTYA